MIMCSTPRAWRPAPLPVSLAARPRDVVVIEGIAGGGPTQLLLTLAGRMKVREGRVKVAGLVLPEQAAAVRRRTAYLDCADPGNLRQSLRAVLAGLAEDHLPRSCRRSGQPRRPGRAGQPAR